MALRAQNPTLSRRAAGVAALSALLALVVGLLLPTTDAQAARGSKAPVVTSISPKKLTVGEKLTIRGRHFRTGKSRNTVVFKRDGGRAVFVKADLSTGKVMRVTIPARLANALSVRNGTPEFTRLRIRIFAGRFGKTFTRNAASPVVGPEKPPVPPIASADADCDTDGVKNGTDGDDDNDLLADKIEAMLRTDSCKLDSDGDGAGDGYEYKSALDLNNDEYQSPNFSLPYPEKRPYPNALFADSHIDFDGDGLSSGEEHSLWLLSEATNLNRLSYSDGLQHSNYEQPHGDDRRVGALRADSYDKHIDFVNWATAAGYLTINLPEGPRDIRDFNRDGDHNASVLYDPSLVWNEETVLELRYFDFDGDNRLSDDERDEDADGLTNYDESHGPMLPAFWTGCYKKEKPYPVPYSATDLADSDSDGDGVRDGADDQDHDDVPNLMELRRSVAASEYNKTSCNDEAATLGDAPIGFVNPFNPCLPNPRSRTCTRHPSLADKFPPFDPEVPNYLVLN